jgi:valyl-tRNA synthetase
MKIGRRLAIKILNASKFALGVGGEGSSATPATEPLDRAMLAGLAEVVSEATAAFDEFDYARALEAAERAFWAWTDDYVELVKVRAYGEGAGAESARAALRLSLSVYLRLFAPFLPFVTEEVWSWWREGSIHRQPWPRASELAGDGVTTAALEAATRVLAEVRRAKSEAKVSMKTPVTRLTVRADADFHARLQLGLSDLLAAAGAEAVESSEGEFEVTAELGAKA